MYSRTGSDYFWRENDMNDILIGSDKLLPTGNYVMEDSPGWIAFNQSQNMFEANDNTHISQSHVNIMLAQNMTTKSPYVPTFNPFSKLINVQSDSQQLATVTTAITSPIMSQVSLGVGSNPVKQTMDTGDKNSCAGSQRLHAQRNNGNGIQGVYDIPDVGVLNGRTTVKVSSQPRYLENQRSGGPGVLRCENQQDMVPGYGYRFYGSCVVPRCNESKYGSPSVPQLGN